MNKKVVPGMILLGMMLWDFTLHLVQYFGVWRQHPLYPMFPLGGVVEYDVFWSWFWGIGCLIVVIIWWLLNKPTVQLT